MEFLRPSSANDHTIRLVLAVTRDDEVELLNFHWELNKELCHLRVGGAVPINRDIGDPLFIVPITFSTGFLLVCEEKVATYPNVLITWANPNVDDLYPPNEDFQIADDPGASNHRPRWTHWTRPMRRKIWSEENDFIYLCRSDGLVRSIQLKEEDLPIGLCFYTDVGNLHLNIDTAFAALKTSMKKINPNDEDGSYDTLITAGTQSEGALLLFKCKEDGIPKQSIPNWGHVLDFAVVPSNALSFRSPKDSNDGRRPYGRDRIFACAGSGLRHGSLCEMRIGIPAQTTALSEIEDVTPSRMWLLPDHSSKGIFMLVSSLEQSRAYRFPNPSQEISVTISDLRRNDSALATIIQTDAETLAATETADRILVQVTSASIGAIFMNTEEEDEQKPLFRTVDDLSISKITKASIESTTSMLLITARHMSRDLLLCAQLTRDNHDRIELIGLGNDMISNSYELPDEPTALTLQIVDNKHIAFVGLRDRTILVYFIRQGVLQRTYLYTFQGDDAICESVLVIHRIRDVNTLEKNMVLCGLRDGTLHVLQMIFTGETGKLCYLYCLFGYLAKEFFKVFLCSIKRSSQWGLLLSLSYPNAPRIRHQVFLPQEPSSTAVIASVG